MSNQRPVRADVQALSGLLRQFDNQLKEQGRSEERSIVLDALKKLEASPASALQSSSDIANQQRLNQVSMQQSKASAA
jgi:hypothetical protein